MILYSEYNDFWAINVEVKKIWSVSEMSVCVCVYVCVEGNRLM